MSKVEYRCKTCGGTNVTLAANAYWNVTTQEFEYEIFECSDLEYCSDCEDNVEVECVDIETRFARVCETTGEGMNEGWVWGDGDSYDKYEANVIKELRENAEAYDLPLFNAHDGSTKTDNELLESAHNLDIVYWTEWHSCLEEEIKDGFYTATGDWVGV